MTFYDIKNGNRFPETLKAGEREERLKLVLTLLKCAPQGKAGVNFIFIL
jgi:hypothetical protein